MRSTERQDIRRNFRGVRGRGRVCEENCHRVRRRRRQITRARYSRAELIRGSTRPGGGQAKGWGHETKKIQYVRVYPEQLGRGNFECTFFSPLVFELSEHSSRRSSTATRNVLGLLGGSAVGGG